MLPLVQMHPMVQPPLDFLGHYHGHLKPGYPLNHHHGSQLSQQPQSPYNTDSTPRAFALRNAQHAPALHRITTSFTRLHAHDQAENSLRRKTPSGTIDNGYDGSLTHLASGPPPPKHMIVPASSEIFPTAILHKSPNQPVGGMLQQPPSGPWAYSAPVPAAKFDHGVEALNSLPGSLRGWGMSTPTNSSLDPGMGDRVNALQPVSQHNYHAGPGMQSILGQGYQQSLSQTVYSPGGYQQPAVWRDGSFGYQTMIPLANNYTPQNSVDGAFMAAQSTIPHGLANASGLGQAQYFGLPQPSHPLNDGFSRYGLSHMTHHAAHVGRHPMPMMPGAGQLVKGAATTTNEVGSPTRFKERALQSAHKAYNDLLLHLTHTRKPHDGRSSSVSRPSSKIMVYPKPSTAPNGSGGQGQPLSGFSNPAANYMQQMAQKEAAARMFAQGHHQRAYELVSPVYNAKASLDMLSTLCEQSGWKWVEGMLLGGCLHYGLERYEEALEWFKRIVNLEPRYVPAPYSLML